MHNSMSWLNNNSDNEPRLNGQHGIRYWNNNQEIWVFPEYATKDIRVYEKMAKTFNVWVIGGVRNKTSVTGVIFNPKGEIAYKRYKHRPFGKFEGLTKIGQKPEIVDVGPFKILLLICFELMFPQDWLDLEHFEKKADFVVHLIAGPMQDSHQAEGWQALHRILAMRFNCDVVVCCGQLDVPPPLDNSPLNLTGVIENA